MINRAKYFPIIVISLLFTFAFAFSFQKQLNKKPGKTIPDGSYEFYWNQADSLSSLGLQRSALKIVGLIHEKARNESNASQLVKSVIHELKFQDYTEENAFIKNLQDIRDEIKSSEFPERPLLHSMLAELYQGYYKRNRYKFLNRTQTMNFKNDDPETWDLKTLVTLALKEYQESLSDAVQSKKTPINIYDEVIMKGNTEEARRFRPTLYDFLAHRALDYYTNEETGLTRPANRFELNSAFYLNNAEMFLNFVFRTEDTTNLYFKAVVLFQDLISFHENDPHPGALIDVDLKRLRFIHEHITIPTKDSLYKVVLQQISDRYKEYPGCTGALLELARLAYRDGNTYDEGKNDKAKWMLLRAESYCDEAITRFPQSEGGQACKLLKQQINTKSISLSVSDVNLPERSFLGKLEYRNINKIYFRIIMDDDSENQQTEKFGEELIKIYLKLNPVQSWSVDLPADSDKHGHSIEIPLRALPAGRYMILLSSNPEFSFEKNGMAYAAFRVSNLGIIYRQLKDGSYDFNVFNRESGIPLPGVTVNLITRKYNNSSRKYDSKTEDTFSSDDEGHIIVPVTGDYRNFNMEFVYGTDKLFLKENFYQDNRSADREMETEKTYFFTDRSIYRPGQAIYFKGIMLKGSGGNFHVVRGKKTLVQFFDVNGQKISEQDLVSNDYGTITGTFTAPQGVLTGKMRIQNEKGSCYFNVEEYKRPKFEIVYSPVKGSYRVGEKITVRGKAQAYSGSSIDGASVNFRVVRTARFPNWIYYRHPYYTPSAEQEILSGITQTNDTGGFQVTFYALPDLSTPKEYDPVFNFRVHVDVTDVNGETRSQETLLSAGYKSFELKSTLPDLLNADQTLSCFLGAENLSGEPVPVEAVVRIHELQDPGLLLRKRLWSKPDKHFLSQQLFRKTFPNDVYSDEDEFSNWKEGAEVYSATLNARVDSTIQLQKTGLKPGVYKMDAIAHDETGQEIRMQKIFTVFRSSSNDVPATMFDWFTVLTDDAAPGGSDRILIGSSDQGVKVLYEVEFKNKIISRQWLNLNQHQQLVEIPVKEEYRGNFAVHFSFIKQNRAYTHTQVMKVPWDNKELKFSYESFRSKLTPGLREEWRIRITGKSGDKVAAEMLASMYDASLDQFSPHKWDFSIYKQYSPTLGFNLPAFSYVQSQFYSKDWNMVKQFQERTYDQLNWFGFNPGNLWSRRGEGVSYYVDGVKVRGAEPSMAPMNITGLASLASTPKQNEQSPSSPEVRKETASGIQVRRNLNETAFFYPTLTTNENGEVIISFTSPEALTQWKFMGLAHTQDLRYGITEKEIVTQKQVMVVSNAPRFLREGDRIEFPVKINSLSDTLMNGTASLQLFDALTMQPVDDICRNLQPVKNIQVSKSQSAQVSWELFIPEKISAVVYKVTAHVGSYSDGEEQALPVLSNRELVTEAMPLWVRGTASKSYSLDKLVHNTSTSLRNHKLTLEYTSNPAWLAVQALPYMMEYPYECSEQVFSRYYANALATFIANSNPKIKNVFDSWKSSSPAAFLSNLEKNQELKSLVLEETPWIAEAKDESERKKRIGILFDLNRMSNELNTALNKLQKAQLPDGAWPWFNGMTEDRYITQYIVSGLAHLEHLGVSSTLENNKAKEMARQAVQYLDMRMNQDFEELINGKTDTAKYHPSYFHIQYMYMRSYFKDLPLAGSYIKAYNFFYSKAKNYWTEYNEYLQGMLALASFRQGDKLFAEGIVRSLKENAQHSDEMGMYWKNNSGGYNWYQASTETQSLLIEVFDEVTKDTTAVEDMKVWLLRQKQTQDWKTTKATAEACYALLLRGQSWISTDPKCDISVGGKKIDLSAREITAEAGTGYFKTSWSGTEITNKMGQVTLKPVNNPSGQLSWGALYWQYFEDLDKITPHLTPLNLRKDLFIERSSATGPVIEPLAVGVPLKTGDRVKVRIELRVDRDMEYVHMKDQRAAGLEPENVLSQYKWQDGLGYYESTRDASTNFFFSYLLKGTYVFEYPLRAFQAGDFSNGITNIECMYAPEFSAHSGGQRVVIVGK